MLVGLQLLRFFSAFLVIFSHVLGEYPSFINLCSFVSNYFDKRIRSALSWRL